VRPVFRFTIFQRSRGRRVRRFFRRSRLSPVLLPTGIQVSSRLTLSLRRQATRAARHFVSRDSARTKLSKVVRDGPNSAVLARRLRHAGVGSGTPTTTSSRRQYAPSKRPRPSSGRSSLSPPGPLSVVFVTEPRCPIIGRGVLLRPARSRPGWHSGHRDVWTSRRSSSRPCRADRMLPSWHPSATPPLSCVSLVPSSSMTKVR